LKGLHAQEIPDRSRLKQLDVAVNQGRHHHLRIDLSVRGGELVAIFEVRWPSSNIWK
jgi:hypothetical protein